MNQYEWMVEDYDKADDDGRLRRVFVLLTQVKEQLDRIEEGAP